MNRPADAVPAREVASGGVRREVASGEINTAPGGCAPRTTSCDLVICVGTQCMALGQVLTLQRQ